MYMNKNLSFLICFSFSLIHKPPTSESKSIEEKIFFLNNSDAYSFTYCG